MILRLSLNEIALQSSEHELSLRQRQPDGPRRGPVNRRAATNLVIADSPIRPGHLHHDPPLLSAPPIPDQADRITPTFWTVSRVPGGRLVSSGLFGETGRITTASERPSAP